MSFPGYPVVNDPLYNHEVFGPNKGRGGDIGGKTDEQLVRDLINIHNAENWLGIDGDSELSMFNKSLGSDLEDSMGGTNKGEHMTLRDPRHFNPLTLQIKLQTGNPLSDDDSESVSREASPCSESPRPVSVGSESPNENICTISNHVNSNNNNIKLTNTTGTSTNMNASAISKMSSNVMHTGIGRSLLLQKTGVSIPSFHLLHFVLLSFSFRRRHFLP
jgi:hypothetical protein